MSSRPLFVKRSRWSHRLIWWTTPILICILVIAAWKIKRHEERALWPPAAESVGAMLVTSSSPRQQAASSDKVVSAEAPAWPSATPSASESAARSAAAGAAALEVGDDRPATDALAPALKTALDQWSSAWRAQDVPNYLGMYAPDFQTPQGMSRRAWAQMRSERIKGKQKIRHDIRDLQIDQQGSTATVKFTQLYADERTEITDRKTMQWVFRDGRWLIRSEATE